MNRRTRWLSVLLLVVFAGSLSCKVQLTPESVSRTWNAIKDARKDLTPENEYYVGRSVGTNLLAKHDYRYLDRDAIGAGQLDGLTAYVNRVGAVVTASALATGRKGDRPTPIAGWHFVIIEDQTINAFAAPGGFVFVTTAAVAAAKSEDELAAILAHEVAHVIRGHALGTIKKSRWAGVAKEFLDSSVELDAATLGKMTKVFEDSMNDMIDAMLVKGYSRKTELEADRVGLEIMAHSGYDPAAFIRYLQTLQDHQQTGSGGFYATHPKASDRIKELAKRMLKLPRRKVPPVRRDRFLVATAMLRNEGAGAPAME